MLLLVADAARVLQLGGLLRLRWPACRIEEESDPVDALLKAVRMPADLVLVDAALSLGPPGVLARHLGRVAPAVSMMVFAERPGAEERPLVSCWNEAAAQIDRWAGERPQALQRRASA